MDGPSLASSGEPRWVEDGLRIAAHEVALYFSTLWGMVRHPYAFSRAFAAGERTLNPLGFLATSAAVMSSVGVVLSGWAGWKDGGSFWSSLWNELAPYAFYIAFGCVIHGVMRLLGSPRRLPTTVGVVILVAAGPLAYSHLLFSVLCLSARVLTGNLATMNLIASLTPLHPVLATVVSLAAFVTQIVFWGWMIAAVAGVQTTWRLRGCVVLAVLTAELISALLAGQMWMHDLSPTFNVYQAQPFIYFKQGKVHWSSWS